MQGTASLETGQALDISKSGTNILLVANQSQRNLGAPIFRELVSLASAPTVASEIGFRLENFREFKVRHNAKTLLMTLLWFGGGRFRPLIVQSNHGLKIGSYAPVGH